MSKNFKINSKLINKAEVGRKAGFTGEYVRLLLSGKRSNEKALRKVHTIIKEQLKAA